MVVGQYGNMKIGAIIQARFDSTRLPGKVLMNLPFDSNETVISQIVNRLKGSLNLNEIVIATSTEENDNVIAEYSYQNVIDCVRGDKKDVLGRFVKVINEKNLDVVVRITGDNPIVLIDVLDKAIDEHFKLGVDYTRNNNLPYGTSFEIINSKILLDINNIEDLSLNDREHVTLYVKNNSGMYKINDMNHNVGNLDFRFTIDYPSDYAFMNILFQYLRTLNYSYSLKDIMKFVEHHSWLNEINRKNIQKKNFVSEEEEIKEACKILEKMDYHLALAKIKKELL